MKRHEVMDLFHGNQNEVLEGPWNDVQDKIPDINSCKVRVQTKDGDETFAYFYADKCNFSPYIKNSSYFWQCVTKEELKNVTHWKALKDG